MSFLYGIFGGPSASLVQSTLHIAREEAKPESLEVVSLSAGVICAGQPSGQAREYNYIFPLNDGGGILVGKFFDREKNQLFTTQNRFSGGLGERPVDLYQHFWGRFAGALYNRTANHLTLVRDPLGLSTLFYMQTDDGVFFSTEISMIYDSLATKPSIDLSWFAERIIDSNNALPSTPFSGIRELLPGMALTISGQGVASEKLMWDLSSFKKPRFVDEAAIEEELLSTLKTCTKAWTHDVDGVCIELSGGLDSSALLITLSEVLSGEKPILAVNLIDSKVPSSNENEYAEEVANLCNVPLQFLDWNNDTLISDLPSHWRPNNPSTFLFFQNTGKQLYNLAQKHGCSEIVNGQGGDHLFLAPPSKESLADYWLDRGFKGIKTPLGNLSSIYRMPWGGLCYEGIRSLFRYYRRCPLKKSESPMPFFTEEYLRTLKRDDFYLQDALKGCYPAKALHIQSLAHAVSYADRSQRFAQTVVSHPLLSQPLVELALKIPTWQSFNESFDRILFRRAANKMKPSKALWRKIKGETTGSMSKHCVQEADAISEMIGGGSLVKSGIINKDWLEKEFIKMRHGQVENLWPILHLLTNQIWLNQWGIFSL